MSPSAGSALWREVQSGGAIIDGCFIPEGYDVAVGVYGIHHNPQYHPQPFTYEPERWYRADGAAAKAGEQQRGAYMPFSVGARGCIGKGLAIVELMLTMATILWRFDFRDPEWEVMNQGRRLEERAKGRADEFLLHDHVTGAKNGPMLQFRIREEE